MSMPTLPFVNIKTDPLDALLATIGLRLQRLSKNKNHAEFNQLIQDKDITIQFLSPTMARLYEFRQGTFRHLLIENTSADLTIDFKDSMTGVKLLIQGDTAAFMSAIQDGDIHIMGDYKLILWFAKVAKHAIKVPAPYQEYLNQAKPYLKKVQPLATKTIAFIKTELDK